MSTASPIAATGSASPPRTPATTTVSDARLPAQVRDGSPQIKQAYATAQSFEEMLLQQLSQSLVQSSGLDGEGEGESGEEGAAGSAEAGGMLASFLPQTLTEGVMHAGGLGLATQLLDSFDPGAKSAASANGAPTPSPSPTNTTPNRGSITPTGGVSA